MTVCCEGLRLSWRGGVNPKNHSQSTSASKRAAAVLRTLQFCAFAMVKTFLHFRSLLSSGLCPLFLFLGLGIGNGCDTLTRVWQLAGPLVEAERMEIVDIEFRHEGSRGGRVLRLYLDKEGGRMDDLSRKPPVSRALDGENTVDGAYTLEVSSPGSIAAQTKPAHFARFVGKRIRVRTRDLIDGRRSFLGILGQVVEDSVILTQEGNAIRFHFR